MKSVVWKGVRTGDSGKVLSPENVKIERLPDKLSVANFIFNSIVLRGSFDSF